MFFVFINVVFPKKKSLKFFNLNSRKEFNVKYLYKLKKLENNNLFLFLNLNIFNLIEYSFFFFLKLTNI